MSKPAAFLPWLELLSEPAALIAPLFVREGIDEPRPIPSLPGVVQHTVETLAKLSFVPIAGVVAGLGALFFSFVRDDTRGLPAPSRKALEGRLGVARLNSRFAFAMRTALAVGRGIERGCGCSTAPSTARTATAPATPPPPTAATWTGDRLARLGAPRLASPRLEPGVGIAKEAREYIWIASAGGRDDFEYGARLLEVWAMDKPASTARWRFSARPRRLPERAAAAPQPQTSWRE